MKENVLDVLMFLFENYLYDEPDDAPDRDSLEENLHQAGFTNGEIEKKVFTNMSERAQILLREDMSAMRAEVSEESILESQKKIKAIHDQLVTDGEI